MPIFKVKKRNGAIVAFDKKNICNAIQAAMSTVQRDALPEGIVDVLMSKSIANIEKGM